MGQDKALLPVEGQPLLVRVLWQLSVLSGDLIVAAGDAERYAGALKAAPAVRCVGDVVEDAGPLSGIYAGLSAARYTQAVVVACDMPFLNVALLGWMAEQLPGHDVVVPRVPETRFLPKTGFINQRAKDTGLHPLHAVYSTTCLEPIRVALDSGERSLGNLLTHLRVRVVEADEIAALDPQFLSLRNINTPEEYDACLQLL
jgi:molybdopterin-guanine dinucleotide biosynthesis protein A